MLRITPEDKIIAKTTSFYHKVDPRYTSALLPYLRLVAYFNKPLNTTPKVFRIATENKTKPKQHLFTPILAPVILKFYFRN